MSFVGGMPQIFSHGMATLWGSGTAKDNSPAVNTIKSDRSGSILVIRLNFGFHQVPQLAAAETGQWLAVDKGSRRFFHTQGLCIGKISIRS
jgi:hypothetical protein